MAKEILKSDFYQRRAPVVAKDLLGKFLVNPAGESHRESMITEVEVYDGPDDLASHAARGRRTARNMIMYQVGGVWYVYLVYGRHQMLNLVTGREDYPAAVLIRSVAAATGPGRVTKYFGIDKSYNGESATASAGRLWVEDRGIKVAKRDIMATPRVGVAYAGPIWSEKLFRFYLPDMIK